MTSSENADEREIDCNVLIVGAGPIGIELAVALKRAGIDYQHVDAKQIGYTISWFAPQTRFFSSNERIAIAGMPLYTPDQLKATREQYLTYLRTIVREHDLKIQTYEPVVGIDRTGNSFRVTTEARCGKRTYRAQRVVLVTGGTDRPRKLNVSGEDLPHVRHYFGDPHEYFDQQLLVIGGKNSAIEAALRSYHAGAKVTLSYRRETIPDKSIKYWLLPEINGLIKEGRISGQLGTVPIRITPTHVTLQKVRWCEDDDEVEPSAEKRVASNAAKRGDDNATRNSQLAARNFGCISVGDPFDIRADFVLALTGYEQDNALFKLAGIELSGSCEAPRFNANTMETNVPGLYVAGTAVGGTQDKYSVFLENCHVHVERIVRAMQGAPPPDAPAAEAMPES